MLALPRIHSIKKLVTFHFHDVLGLLKVRFGFDLL